LIYHRHMLQMILQILNMILHLAQGADIDKYLQHASTFKHMHRGANIPLSLVGIALPNCICPCVRILWIDDRCTGD